MGIGSQMPGKGIYKDNQKESFHYQSEADYLIFKDEDNIIAVDGTTKTEYTRGTDAHTVIQAAINALPDGRGGKVYIHPGNYTLTDTIRLYRNYSGSWTPITLQGSGIQSTQLTLADGANCDAISFEVSGSANDGFKEVCNMKLEGNKNNNTSGRGLYSETTGSGTKFDDCYHNVYIHKFKEDNIYLHDGWGTRVYKTLSETADGRGMNLKGSQCYVSNVYISASTGTGFRLRGEKSAVNNVYVNDSGEHGCSMPNTDYTTITNLRIRTWGSELASAYFGLQISPDSHYNNLSSVIIEGDGTNNCFRGLRIQGDYNVVSDVISINSGFEELQVETEATDNTISTNRHGAVLDEGTRTVLDGLGTNAGDPGTGGDWNGNGYEGVIVRDTSNNNTYIYNDGSWSQIASS